MCVHGSITYWDSHAAQHLKKPSLFPAPSRWGRRADPLGRGEDGRHGRRGACTGTPAMSGRPRWKSSKRSSCERSVRAGWRRRRVARWSASAARSASSTPPTPPRSAARATRATARATRPASRRASGERGGGGRQCDAAPGATASPPPALETSATARAEGGGLAAGVAAGGGAGGGTHGGSVGAGDAAGATARGGQRAASRRRKCHEGRGGTSQRPRPRRRVTRSPCAQTRRMRGGRAGSRGVPTRRCVLSRGVVEFSSATAGGDRGANGRRASAFSWSRQTSRWAQSGWSAIKARSCAPSRHDSATGSCRLAGDARCTPPRCATSVCPCTIRSDSARKSYRSFSSRLRTGGGDSGSRGAAFTLPTSLIPSSLAVRNAVGVAIQKRSQA